MDRVKFFLDTNALIYFSGLKGLELQHFKDRIKATKSKLIIAHIQLDEVYGKELKNYHQKVEKALRSLRNKGINVFLEATKIIVFGISRYDLARFGNEKIGELYNELRKEIDECQKAKGKPKPPSNIARDAVIAISSLDHDFFITTDECLFKSWRNVIHKHRTLKQQFKIPKIVHARRSPKEVAKKMLNLLS